jgi:hypothetical protein
MTPSCTRTVCTHPFLSKGLEGPQKPARRSFDRYGLSPTMYTYSILETSPPSHTLSWLPLQPMPGRFPLSLVLFCSAAEATQAARVEFPWLL